MNWSLVFTAQAKKDAKKLASSGLKAQAQRVLEVLAANPYQTPPRYEKLIGNLAGNAPVHHRAAWADGDACSARPERGRNAAP